MKLLRINKQTAIILSSVLILILGMLIVFLSTNKEVVQSSVISSPDLVNHPIYSNYNFDSTDSIINIGIQPMYLPTGIIMEVVKRDKILNKAISSLGKQIKYYPFLKGADVNYYLKQKMIDCGIGGDMPALSIASVFDVVIPIILQKGNVSIVSNKPMLSDDLRGKRIAYPYGSISHYFLLELMQSAGITENMVELIPMEISSMATALNNNDIDLFSAWEPIISSAMKQYPEFHITYKKITTGYLYFSATTYNDNPDFAKQILSAVIRSISWMKNSRENLLLACEWNLEEMEELTGIESVLNAVEIAEIAKADLIGYHSKYSVVIKDKYIRKNSTLYNEYEFLSELNKDGEYSSWKIIAKLFDNNLVTEILEHPEDYRLNEYDYDIGK